MDNIINKILEIDQEANKKLEIAKNRSKQIISEARLEEEKIKADSLQKAEAKIQKVDDTEKAEAEGKINYIQKQMNNKIEEFQRCYNNNHEQWEDEIIKTIIG